MTLKASPLNNRGVWRSEYPRLWDVVKRTLNGRPNIQFPICWGTPPGCIIRPPLSGGALPAYPAVTERRRLQRLLYTLSNQRPRNSFYNIPKIVSDIFQIMSQIFLNKSRMIFEYSITNALSKKTTPQAQQKMHVFQKIRYWNIFSFK